MKISRFKKSQKILAFFSTNFDYRQPYQVIIDATFCQTALHHKVIVEEQLKRYFVTPVKLLTTQCIILEAESLGAPLTGATQIVKQFHVHKCGHEGKAVTAAECIASMTRDSRYIVASQDRTLQERLRKVPGRCLLYLHNASPVLEEPSKASKKHVERRARNLLPAQMKQRIVHLKQEQGLPTATALPKADKKNRKAPKNPNPLSCKKSKKSKQTHAPSVSETSKPQLKAKRKRLKVAAHIKAAAITYADAS